MTLALERPVEAPADVLQERVADYEDARIAEVRQRLGELSMLDATPGVASERFYSVVEQTPTVRIPRWALPADVQDAPFELHAKQEGLQRSRSYKVRGLASYLDDKDRAAQVVIASTGNHAQSSAVVAEGLGFEKPVRVEGPYDMAGVKVRATRGRNADVRAGHKNLPSALSKAKLLGEQPGFVFAHPYDDPRIIAGQGTVALEVIDHFRRLDYSPATQHILFVPGGGGGLGAGCVEAANENDPLMRVRLSQMFGSHAIALALQGEKISAKDFDKACDGAAVQEPGELPLAILSKPGALEAVDVVTKAEIGEAMAVLAAVGEVPEPAGALAMAAALRYMRENKDDSAGQPMRVLTAVTSGVMLDSAKASEFLTPAVSEGFVTPQRAFAVVTQADTEAKRCQDELEASSNAVHQMAHSESSAVSSVWSGLVAARGPVSPDSRHK